MNWGFSATLVCGAVLYALAAALLAHSRPGPERLLPFGR
jgi:hypothetical protein